MSELMAGTTSEDEALRALRDEIVGDYRPFTEIAAALGCCVRTVSNVAARHKIRVVKINNEPHAKPSEFRRALLGEPPSARGRGRPHKSA
jgi:hypothetical protein